MMSRPESFPRVARLIKGYDTDEVDEFVTRVLETLDKVSEPRRPVTATEARNIRFRWSFGGYAPDVVDEALDAWATQLPQ